MTAIKLQGIIMFPATISITYNVNGDREYQGFQTHDVSGEQHCMRTMHALYPGADFRVHRAAAKTSKTRHLTGHLGGP